MADIRRAVGEADIQAASGLIDAMAAWDIEATRAKGCPTDDLVRSVYGHTPASLARKYADPHALLLARVGSDPAGCIAFTDLGSGAGEIEKLFVAPPFRGLGIGRQLMTAVLARMEAGGCPAARLETVSFMTEAIGLYRSFGFRPCAPFRAAPIGLERITVYMERAAEPHA